MKKTALFLAMASATAFVNAETVEIPVPTFYGKINLTQEFIQQEDGDSYSELNSNASRLGVKGDFSLTDNVTAVYQAEYQIDVDGDAGQTFTERNTFIGAKGSFGRVQAGIFDTALKASQGKVDLFNDLYGDIKNTVTNSDNRPSNILRYQSPSFSGLVLTFDHINGESEEVNDEDVSQPNAQSMSAVYNRDNYYVAVAYDSGLESAETDVVRVTGQVTLGEVKLGALWESEDVDGESSDGMMVSAAFKASSAVTLKGQYSDSDIKAEGLSQFSLGADYKLAKNAKVFAYMTNVDYDGETSDQAYGAGAEYKF